MFTGMSALSVVLRVIFSLLGLSAIAIGAMNFALGPTATAATFATILSTIAHTPRDVEGLSGPNIDSEMRFYSVLWIAYGSLALWVSQSLKVRIVWLRLMLVVFLFGGIGRALSFFSVGPPHPLFSILMWIELLLPTLLIALSYGIPRRADSETGN